MSDHDMPKPPQGFSACRTGCGQEKNTQISHLVKVVGNGTPGTTLCGLTRFDERDENYNIVKVADIPGWSMNGGWFGPDVTQIKCGQCWEMADV